MEVSFTRYPFKFPHTRLEVLKRLETLQSEASELRGDLRVNDRARFERWASKIGERYGQGDSASKANHLAELASSEARGITEDIRAELACVEAELALIQFAVAHNLIAYTDTHVHDAGGSDDPDL
jgi:hypothetical protein